MPHRGALVAGLATAVSALILAGGAGAAAPRFPVPSCKWAPAPMVSKAFGLKVRALKGSWSTQIAPVMTCRYVEVNPSLQAPGRPIVVIQFRELQRFGTKGLAFVPHLGSCVEHSSCPQPHKPAWELVRESNSSPTFAFPFDSAVQLRVEDGLNAVVVQVTNPDGPMSISDEPGAAERLTSKLLPRFRWK